MSDLPADQREPSTPRPRREHPTRLLLIETARSLLSKHPVFSITAEMVLTASGVSKGSLYHHFEDFDDLMGTAMVRGFSEVIQQNIAIARAAFEQCDSAGSLQSMFRQVTRATQPPELPLRRLERIQLIAFSRSNPRHRRMLAKEQSRLTDAFEELFARGQDNGWLNRDFAPRAGAVLIQTDTIGRIVDDIVSDPVEDESWFGLIDLLTSRVFAPPTPG